LLFWNQVPDNEREELRHDGLQGFIYIREPSALLVDSRNLFQVGLAYKRKPMADGTRRISYMLDLDMLELQLDGI
jgi:hypothetical protein